MGHLALLAAGARFDPAWLADGVDGLILLVALAVMGRAGPPPLARAAGASRRAAGHCSCPAIHPRPAGGRCQSQAARALAEVAGDADSLLVTSDRFGSALLEIQEPRVTGQRAPTAPDDPLAAGLWQSALADAGAAAG